MRLRPALLLLLFLLAFTTRAAWSLPRYGHSAIAQRNGYPVFTVDGKPFFVYGAAFFYERLPRDRWRDSMLRLRALGINTLDLYVPWNWHELSDGNFDFDGHTSPRRDLREVLRLARELHFAIILRPGPVIRNEWRNGGYPAWLLRRPEYGMPRHDLLEGRYPPTATLQNAHSDDAAAQWMSNAVHMRYAERWLKRVLRECRPVADRVIAVQLDDDQGAYIDNQTWPAPHLRAYLRRLAAIVHEVTGPSEPVFINTYEMKVTASSPVWAMGNWYQSDVYAIGEHDRTELDLATGLLQTQPDKPLMYSEFQAGWLQQPGETRSRPADPSNTELAIGTLLARGVRGVVNFPAQDTLYPSGMEVPFANAFYAWDAALKLDGCPQARAVPTRRVGALIAAYGPRLAASHVLADAAVVSLTSAFDERTLDNAAIARITARTGEALRVCRTVSLSCAVIDLRFIPDAELRRYPVVVLPLPSAQDTASHLIPFVRERLAHYTESGGRVLPTRTALRADEIEAALRAVKHARIVNDLPGATFAREEDGRGLGFLIAENYGDRPLRSNHLILHPDSKRTIVLPSVEIAPRSLLIVAFDKHGRREAPAADRLPPMPPPPDCAHGLPISADQCLPDVPVRNVSKGEARALNADIYREGDKAVVLSNALVRLILAPNAGARAFVFEDLASRTNVFTTIGALRDDVRVLPPPSTTDRIAAYTSQFPAGTFNRAYKATILETGHRARVRFTYDAPDVVPSGAHFERTVTLLPDRRDFTVQERALFDGSSQAQRAVTVSSLSVGASSSHPILLPSDRKNAVGLYDPVSHELALLAWRRGDIEEAHSVQQGSAVLLRLTLAPGRTVLTRYGMRKIASLTQARWEMERFGENTRADGEMAER